jgi:hypothetical protein
MKGNEMPILVGIAWVLVIINAVLATLLPEPLTIACAAITLGMAFVTTANA